MSNYETENVYIDGEENRPRLFVLFGIVILIVIILVLVISCGMKGKSTNNYLSTLTINNAELSPKFSKNTTTYNVNPKSNNLVVYCTAESSKAKAKGCNKAIDLSLDGSTHKIVVTAEDKTTKTYILNFIKSDKLVDEKDLKDTEDKKDTNETSTAAYSEALSKVVISSNIESGKKTNKPVTLTAVVTPSNSKVTYVWYKDGIEISNSNNNKYEAKTSGSYYVRVTDGTIIKESTLFKVNIGNTNTVSTKKSSAASTSIKQATLKINSITGNSSTWVKSVTLKVNATGAKYYSFDGGKSYQTSNSKTFTKNGTYTIVVKSSAGKTISKQILINKIDNSNLKVSLKTSNNTGKSVNLTANVSSNTSSSYKYEWYVNNKKISGATKSTFKATMEGTYKVKVTNSNGRTVYSNEYNKVKVMCPTLSATTESGKSVQPYTWYGEYIYIKIVPSKETVSYDVYMNEDGHYNVLDKHFKYFNTYKGNVKVRLVNGGMRLLKIVVKDSSGNTNTCYTHAYYLR